MEKSTKNLLVFSSVVILGLCVFWFSDNHKILSNTKNCDTSVNFTLGGQMYPEKEMPTEQQHACLLKDLEQTKPVAVTPEKIGDIQLSLVKLYADGKAIANSDEHPTGALCTENAGSRAESYGCVANIESGLQTTIQGLIQTIIQKPVEQDEFGYAKYTEQALKDWYVSEAGSDSLRVTTCYIENRDSWGGTINPERIVQCFIKYDAQQILWLLENFKEEVKESYL